MTQEQKLEKKQRKQSNRSVRSVSQQTERELGIYGIQPEDGVIYLSDEHTYVRFYDIPLQELSPKKRVNLFKFLTDMKAEKMRVSTFRRRHNDKTTVITFLTVFFQAEDYFSFLSVLNAFESELEQIIRGVLGVSIKKYDFGNALLMMRMNFTGKMLDYQHISDKGRIDLWKYLDADMTSMNGGIVSFANGSRYAKGYTGMQFPTDFEGTGLSLNTELTIYSAIEFQALEVKTIKKVLLSYMVEFVADDLRELNEECERLSQQYSDKGMVIAGATSKELELHKSLCSMGVVSFSRGRFCPVELMDKLVAL